MLFRSGVDYDLTVRVARESAVAARQGSLDHFLVERYTLFCSDRRGRLYSGQVHHEPYRIQRVQEVRVRESMLGALIPDLPVLGVPEHVVFSEGVDVRISPIQPL